MERCLAVSGEMTVLMEPSGGAMPGFIPCDGLALLCALRGPALRPSGWPRRSISARSPQRPQRLTASPLRGSTPLLPVQKIANGLSGDPVPFSMRSGAAVNRNSND